MERASIESMGRWLDHEEENEVYTCTVCRVDFSEKELFVKHVKSEREHRMNVDRFLLKNKT